MARVNVDFIPTISEVVSDDPGVVKLVDKLNTSFSRLNEIIRQLSTAINTIEFANETSEENILCDIISTEFGSAGAVLSASHSLGRKPIAIAGTRLDSAGDVWFASEPTSANIYLKSNTASLSGSIIIV